MSDQPYDVTATAIFDNLEGLDTGKFMKDLDASKRLQSISSYLQRALKWTNWKHEMKGAGLIGQTNAAYLSQFIETRHILSITMMKEQTFSEQLQHLQNDVINRGIGNFSLANVSSIQDLELITHEAFEEMMKPIWDMYPYRDDGHLRRFGMTSEKYSFCQLSEEWSIETSFVECVIARYSQNRITYPLVASYMQMWPS